MAIVTDERWVRIAFDTLSYRVAGEIKSYALDDYEAAKKWVSAPLDEVK